MKIMELHKCRRKCGNKMAQLAKITKQEMCANVSLFKIQSFMVNLVGSIEYQNMSDFYILFISISWFGLIVF